MFELQLTDEKMGEGEMTITLMCEVFEGFVVYYRVLEGTGHFSCCSQRNPQWRVLFMELIVSFARFLLL